jgi:glycosyltransferase involved in cell wall biosynthesis
MRLAVVSTMRGFPWGGSEELWAAMAEQALGRGIDVEAFLYRWPLIPPRVAQLQSRGLRVVYRDRDFVPSLLVRAGAKLTRRPIYLRQQLARSRPDLICLSLGSAHELTADADTCRVLEDGVAPYVIVCQQNYDSWKAQEPERRRARRFFERAALVVFVADQNRRSTERQIATRLRNAVVLQNPVNLRGFDPVPWPAPGPARLACVARLEVSAKGQDLLFEALGTPTWRCRDWILALYGQGPDEGHLRELAGVYGLVEKVAFRGHVSDIAAVWAENELLVLPSLSEGTPLSLIEALVCGRPAVVTDVGGSASWVVEAESGFVAEGATAASVGNALERAWRARPDWQRLGGRAHERTMAGIDRCPGATLLDKLLERGRCR